MREIKFRAWDGEQFWYSDDLLHFNTSVYGCDIKNSPFNIADLEQYTGLKDKNGVEIYEGDILDFNEKEWGGKFKPEIINLDNMLGEWSLCGSLIDLTIWRTVIGNKHENPELLND